jgi:hypothetical protein
VDHEPVVEAACVGGVDVGDVIESIHRALARTAGTYYRAVSPLVGIVVFLVVIAALFAATFALSSRYVRGSDRRRVEDSAREIALRDGNAGTPTGGFLPYFGNENPSPRERLRTPEDDERG